MYFTFRFTPYQSLPILLSVFSSVSFDIISVHVLECVCVCVLYLMNECLLNSFTLKVSQAALTYYISTRTVIFAAPSLQQILKTGAEKVFIVLQERRYERETFCFT